MGYIPRLRKYYEEVINKELTEKYGNPMRVPKLQKIVINCGLGKRGKERAIFESAVESLKEITGQKPVTTRAKKSISAFYLREGDPVGLKVTLRGNRMYEFLDRLVNVAIPRIRDFRGLSPDSFDGRGNYTFGISEQFIFPEIDYNKVKEVIGMDITITTTAKNDEEGLELLKRFGFPFRIRKGG
ncbi:MAG: 50S ribosomal protein L5 [candidate division WOR-3 bacterium]